LLDHADGRIAALGEEFIIHQPDGLSDPDNDAVEGERHHSEVAAHNAEHGEEVENLLQLVHLGKVLVGQVAELLMQLRLTGPALLLGHGDLGVENRLFHGDLPFWVKMTQCNIAGKTDCLSLLIEMIYQSYLS